MVEYFNDPGKNVASATTCTSNDLKKGHSLAYNGILAGVLLRISRR
jgi:hypothetical protein